MYNKDTVKLNVTGQFEDKCYMKMVNEDLPAHFHIIQKT